MNKNYGGPAFPRAKNVAPGMKTIDEGATGISIRDYFAAMAMAGDWASQFEQDYFSNGVSDAILEGRAKEYYRMADAMIKTREEI